MSSLDFYGHIYNN